MNQTEAIIERVKRINTEVQHLELAVEEPLLKIKPGQSLLVRVDSETWHPYLREHWWPVAMKENKLIIERPRVERFEPGQLVNVLGLIGQPYRFRRTLRNILLIAYDTSPTPLLMTIPWMLGNNISVTMVLLGSAKKYSTQHLPPEVEIVLGDDEDDPLSWPDQVMTVGWADQVFVTVCEDDELSRFKGILDRFMERRADVPQNYMWGVFRPPLPCGSGACSACMLRTRKGHIPVCTEGPAFDVTQVNLG